MRTAKIMRKDLKIHFKELSPTFTPKQTELLENVDYMPVVQLLSRVSYHHIADTMVV